MADGFDDVACSRLPLRPDQRRALGDATECLTEIRGATDERDLERPLVDVMRFVRRSEHLALVDVVDLQRLENLRLGEVADPHLRHYRDRDGPLDRVDQRRVAHARHAALATDVRRHPLERHDRHRAGVFGDFRVLRGDDVHDHPAPQHLGEASLHPVGTGQPTFRTVVSQLFVRCHTPNLPGQATNSAGRDLPIHAASSPSSLAGRSRRARPGNAAATIAPTATTPMPTRIAGSKPAMYESRLA